MINLKNLQENTIKIAKALRHQKAWSVLQWGSLGMDVNENGDLIVNHAGETNRFIEIESGVYHNLREGSTPDAYGEFQTIVFKTDPFGNIMLTTDGPMTYSKAPWYATSSFTFLSIILAVLIFIGSMISWSVAWIIRKIKRKKAQHSKGSGYRKMVSDCFWTFNNRIRFWDCHNR